MSSDQPNPPIGKRPSEVCPIPWSATYSRDVGGAEAGVDSTVRTTKNETNSHDKPNPGRSMTSHTPPTRRGSWSGPGFGSLRTREIYLPALPGLRDGIAAA